VSRTVTLPSSRKALGVATENKMLYKPASRKPDIFSVVFCSVPEWK